VVGSASATARTPRARCSAFHRTNGAHFSVGCETENSTASLGDDHDRNPARAAHYLCGALAGEADLARAALKKAPSWRSPVRAMIIIVVVRNLKNQKWGTPKFERLRTQEASSRRPSRATAAQFGDPEVVEHEDGPTRRGTHGSAL
jgi:hypothetical protein